MLPDYPAPGNVVTVHQLLNHTSGIPSYTGLGAEFWSKSSMNLTHEELTSMFYDDALEFEPGSKMAYNNSGYYLLGMIIAEVSNMTYEEYLQANIFEPLGLEDTSYCREKYIIKRRAQGYEMESGELVNDGAIGMNSPYAAGALCSTIGDLAKWTDALHNGQVVSAESFTTMITKTKLADGSEQNYGYGLSIGSNVVGNHISHGGGINGFSTLLSYFPEDELLVAVLANSGSAQASDVARNLSVIALGIDKRNEEAAKAAASGEEVDLSKYVGEYSIGPDKTLVMTERNGELFGKPEDDSEQKLVSISKTEFDVPGIGGRVVFDFDDQDNVTKMTLHMGDQQMEAEKIQSASDEIDLNDYAGEYTFMGQPLTMSVRDGKLYGEPQGQSEEQLVPINKTDFDLPGLDAKARFTFNEQGQVSKMTFMKDGQEMDAPKKMEDASAEEKAWDYPEAVELDPKTTDRILGTYEIAPGFSIEVFKDDKGVLMTQATNQPAFELFAVAENYYFLKVVEARLLFEANDKGIVTGVVLEQGGKEIPGRKVD